MNRDEAGQRLDKLLVSHQPSLTRQRAAELCASGRVRVDGRIARKGEVAAVGTQVAFELPPARVARPDPDAPLRVVLERPDLVVVDKPAGQPTAPRDGGEGGTVANALVARYPEMGSFGHSPLEPGLLHRLDTGTWGLLVAARNRAAFDTLTQALRAGRIHKRYLAIVAGQELPAEGRIAKPIAPHPRSVKRVIVCEDCSTPGARAAETRWRVIRRSADFTLVELDVCRAVRHQIRAHLAALGHPLCGDATYGGPPCAALGAGHALCASYVAWAGDAVVPPFDVEAALPEGIGVLMRG